MDEQTRIDTYKQSLRVRYANDLVGLKKKIEDLAVEAESSVVITSSSFEGEQSAGQLVLEPLAKLAAALSLLAELDPTCTPPAPDSVVFADFRRSFLQT